MKQKLVKKLVELVDGGVKKSSIEKDAGLPPNSLSSVLSGKKEMPDSWIDKVNNYFFSHENSPSGETKLIVDEQGLKIKPSGNKLLQVTDTMKKLNKDFGEGTVMFFGSKPNQDYDVISTGSLTLDDALGIGGLPRGRMVEIFGMESSGKTTIAMNVIANAQKKGLKCLLVDAENSFDPEYAESLGIEINELIYCQPSYGEQGFEVADQHICSGEVGVVVIDSVAAMIPRRELEGEVGDSVMGLHARLMSQVCRKMVSSAARTNTLVIFINQVRNKIGVLHGNPEVTTGGMALQFYASIRLRVGRSTTKENSVMNGDNAEGNLTTVKVIKNKCSPPFRTAKFYIMYGKGVDIFNEVIDMAIDKNIIQRSGSWFSYNNDKLGQGREAVKQLMIDNPELATEIENEIRAKEK